MDASGISSRPADKLLLNFLNTSIISTWIAGSRNLHRVVCERSRIILSQGENYFTLC